MLSHVLLFAIPCTVAHQAPTPMGLPRQEYWSGLPFPSPGDLPDSGRHILYHCATYSFIKRWNLPGGLDCQEAGATAQMKCSCGCESSFTLYFSPVRGDDCSHHPASPSECKRGLSASFFIQFDLSYSLRLTHNAYGVTSHKLLFPSFRKEVAGFVP